MKRPEGFLFAAEFEGPVRFQLSELQVSWINAALSILPKALRPLPKLTIAPELLYTGAFQDFLIDNNGFSTTTGNTGQGLVANLTVTYDVTPRMAVYAHANNIFDSKFEPVNGYQMPGPSVWVGMRFKI